MRIRASHCVAAVLIALFSAGLPPTVAAVPIAPGEDAPASSAALPSGFQESVAFTGLTQPTSVRFAPDGRVFVAEKSGLIKVFDNLADSTPTVFADLRTNVHNFWDRGLLGMALHPQFATNPYVYVLYTHDAAIGGTAPRWGTVGGTSDGCPDPPGATTNGCVVSSRVSRLQAGASQMVGLEQVLVEDWCQQFQSHSAGSLAFGPDGALYATGGEGAHTSRADYGQFGDPLNPCGDPPVGVGGTQTRPSAEGGALRSQDMRTLGDPVGLDGTLIRIDPTTGAGLPTNPLASSSDPNARRVLAYGLRNPFRITAHPTSGEVWVADVGWGRSEEINRVVNPGDGTLRNYGWPCFEGPGRQPTWDSLNLTLCENLYTESASVTPPHFSYDQDVPVAQNETCSNGSSAISGLAFYPAGPFPASYDGALFFSDYARDCIWVMFKGANGLPDPATVIPFVQPAANPVDLQVSPAGDLFYVDLNGGTVRRIQHFSANSPPIAAASASPTFGAVPLTVNFDGTGTTDPDPGDALNYAWDLDGDGAFDDALAPTATWTYTQPGTVAVRLRVTDPDGASNIATVSVSPGNTPPTATISAPAVGARWKVGDTVTFAGSATDPQSGSLPATALKWQLILHHCPSTCHEHPIQEYFGVSGGSFVAPDHDYPSHLELRLTATDPGGLSHTASRPLDPQTSLLTFDTVPSGLDVVVGTEQRTTPFTQEVITGSGNSISAPTPQTLGGTAYQFASWSDGGAQSHSVTATGDASFVATFTPAGSADQVVLEAESPSASISRGGRSWVQRSDRVGFVGSGFMVTEPDSGASINDAFATTSPELQYTVTLPSAGTWYVWLRGYGTNTANDSVHVGIDGTAPASADRMSLDARNAWTWFNTTMDGPVASLTVASAGTHTINVWMREDGFRLDRLLLTTSASYVPTGEGPPAGGTPPPSDTTPPTLGSAVVSAGTVTATFSESISPATPTGFSVTVNGVARGILGATRRAADPTTVDLALASPVSAGQTVLLSYTPGNVTDQASPANPLAAFSNRSVTNATPAGSADQVVLEAESPSASISRGGRSWVQRSDRVGFVGSGFMVTEPDSGASINDAFATTSPELQYTVTLPSAGTWYVWLRGYGTNTANDSVHVGIDGTAPASADRMSLDARNAWTWFNTSMDGPVASLTVASAGTHTINVWMREDGFRLDRLLLTTSASYVPTGEGPPAGGTPPPSDTTPPTLGSAVVSAGTVTATFSESISPATPTGFSVTVNGVARGIVGATRRAADPTTVDLALASPVSAGQTVLLSYTPGNVTDQASPANPLAAFSNRSVTNATPAGSADQVVLEAESPSASISRGGRSWVQRSDRVGFVGSGFMVTEPDSGASINDAFATTSPELQYTVTLPSAGTWYVWLRGYGTNTANDSVHVGIDGTAPASADRMSLDARNAWTWFNTSMDGPVASLTVASAGTHTINVWMREDGFRLDRLLLTTSASYVPTGEGPPAGGVASVGSSGSAALMPT